MPAPGPLQVFLHNEDICGSSTLPSSLYSLAYFSALWGPTYMSIKNASFPTEKFTL